MKSSRQKALLTEAEILGIKNPERLDQDQLMMAIGIFRKIQAIYRQAAGMNINLPADIVSLGQIERLFKKAVEDRLRAITKDATIRYKSEDWIVERIIKTPRSKRSATYVLRPVKGGKPVKVFDTSLLQGLE